MRDSKQELPRPANPHDHGPPPATGPTLSVLKDFQRRTVDYVFKRMWEDESPAHRFLVADEVGLGKTLVARGIVARTLVHLWDRVGRIDVVYICSNASIARQNVRRLGVGGLPHAVLPTRLTLLPKYVRNLNRHKVNFISLTPGTSLNTTKANRGGTIEERLVLLSMLRQLPVIEQDDLLRNGLRNLLQCLVTNKSYEWHLRWCTPTVDKFLTRRFLTELKEDGLHGDLIRMCEQFGGESGKRVWPWHTHSQPRFALVGRLRRLLASTSVDALEPDLVILDEFQRFRDLLDSDSPAARLTRQLLDFRYKSDSPEAGLRNRVLLLSATPYKMLTLHGEDGEDHYKDFIRTCEFLCDDDKGAKVGLVAATKRYRLGLLDGQGNDQYLDEARRDLQAKLLRFMVRTERVRASARGDAMLRGRVSTPAVRPEDLWQARVIDRVVAGIKARDPIEYWKSAPYLLNVMRDYKLKRLFKEACEAPSPELAAAVREGDRWLLKRAVIERYHEIAPSNPRLRQLIDDTVGQGQWKWLWMPPALPYLESCGAYASPQPTGATKALVFSSWVVVPDAIAAFCSYEANRLMLAGESGQESYPAYSELHKRKAQLLNFPLKDDGAPGAMNTMLLLYPSPTLADVGDPLALALEAGAPVSPGDALERVEARLRARFAEAAIALPEGSTGSVDQRWYWAAPALLDRTAHTDARHWAVDNDGWEATLPEGSRRKGFLAHLQEFRSAASLQADLGAPPDDLLQVLALTALSGPGVCALRALRRVTGADPALPELLSGAAKVARGLRSTFNMPESTALIRSQALDRDTRYWELVLRYALDGNLQAVLDEYAHVLEESLGLMGRSAATKIDRIAREMVEALSIRTSQVRMDDIRCYDNRHVRGSGSPADANGDDLGVTAVVPGDSEAGDTDVAGTETLAIHLRPFNVRTRFALRFGDLQDERGASIQRADTVRKAFNSPFRPFILASTSIGQEGLDFHTYCHAVYHWNLPHNPVDLEQREGRVHRYKGHAVRKNVAERYGLSAGAEKCTLPGPQNGPPSGDPWKSLFARARDDRPADSNDLVPYWVFEDGSARVERRVPVLPFSSEVGRLRRLIGSLAVYRLAFGQPRQEDLIEYLRTVAAEGGEDDLGRFRVSLVPPDV